MFVVIFQTYLRIFRKAHRSHTELWFCVAVTGSESKAHVESAREKLNEIRAARKEQETRVREAANLFLKVN